MDSKQLQNYKPDQDHGGDPTYKPRGEYDRVDADRFDRGRGKGQGRGRSKGRGRGRDRAREEKPPPELDDVLPYNRQGKEVTVFCLPRKNECQSRKFIDLLNNFGKAGGFTLVLQAIAKEQVSLTAAFTLSTMIS